MELRLLESKKNITKFMLKSITPAFANALRRSMLEDVPVMAIEHVELHKNSSVMYDEMIAHRLGLVPLTTDLKSYVLPKDCKCEGEGCARCQVKLSLKAKGPGIVLISEMKSTDPHIKPVFADMPIVKLLKGQQLEFEATAQLGRGSDHAKWQPCLAFYQQRPIVEIKGSIDDPGKLVETCPVNVFTLKNNKAVVSKDDVLRCHLCAACTDVFGKNIEVSTANDFIFTVESWGQLSAKHILLKAVELLGQHVEELGKALKAA